ncbi:hypothetical protein ACF1FE_37490 [Streptomyces griseofuscus]|uniref:hypothetical protein n=1 Tax=Streptomyces griseofuscus TaxID=146922 RepID=UPI0036F4EB34
MRLEDLGAWPLSVVRLSGGLGAFAVSEAGEEIVVEAARPPSGMGVGLPVRVYHSSAPVYWMVTWAWWLPGRV